MLASTFDRPPADHIAVAELAIEKAKRLVETGRDVVVLLDSITRLARAYNLAAPSNGRTMSGGIDSTALHGPKRLLGAARNIEGGGSLTIIATALVETGSRRRHPHLRGVQEHRQRRAAAAARAWPTGGSSPPSTSTSSGTRNEELLLDREELLLMRRLRHGFAAMDPQQSIGILLDRLRKTGSNAELLRHLARSKAA